jgi:hypothetical protein
MGLHSGDDSVTTLGSCGGGGSVVTAPLVGGGGGGGHTSDPVSGETQPASLAPVRGTRVLMGQPLGPIWIHVVCLYTGLSGDVGTGMTSTGSSSSSSLATATSTTPSAMATPSSPSLGLGDDNTELLSATR